MVEEKTKEFIDATLEGNMIHFKTKVTTVDYEEYTVDEHQAKNKLDEAYAQLDNLEKEIYSMQLKKEDVINFINIVEPMLTKEEDSRDDEESVEEEKEVEEDE